MVKADRKTRMELRVTSEQKELFRRAALASGLNLTSYVIARMVNNAREDVARLQSITLTDRDRELVLSLLRNPPKPNKKMADLMSGRHAKSKSIGWNSDSRT